MTFFIITGEIVTAERRILAISLLSSKIDLIFLAQKFDRQIFLQLFLLLNACDVVRVSSPKIYYKGIIFMSATHASGYIPPEQQFYTGEIENLEKIFNVWDAGNPPAPAAESGRTALIESIRLAKAQTVAAGGSHIEVKTVCSPAMIRIYRALLAGLENLKLAAAPLSKICTLLAVSDNKLCVESKNDFLRQSVIARDLQKWLSEADTAKGNPLKQLTALEIVAVYGLSPEAYEAFLSIAAQGGIFGRLHRYLSEPENIINDNPSPETLWTDLTSEWDCLIAPNNCPHRNPQEVIK